MNPNTLPASQKEERPTSTQGQALALAARPYWTAAGTAEYQHVGESVLAARSILDNTIFRVIVGIPGLNNGQSGEGGAKIY